MSDNVAITAGAGTSVAADEVVDATLGTVKAQFVKVMDGTLDSTNKMAVNAGGAVLVTGSTTIVGTVSVTGSTVVVGTVTITGSTTLVGTSTITGSTSVINTVAVTGSVVALGGTAGTSGTNVISVQGIASMVPVTVTGSTVIISMPAITGSTSVINTVTITGSTAVVNTVTVTGSTAVVGTVTITGSTAIIGTVTVTGSTAIVGSVTITGSTTLVGTSTVTGNTTLVHIGFPNKASVYSEVATAGTTTLVPSHATLSIYLTDLIISNGAAAGSIKFGETNTTTASNVKIGSLYFAVNGGCVWPLINPIKCSATTPLVMTAVSCTTLSATATYYYAA